MNPFSYELELGDIVEATEENGLKLELLRHVSYLPYCRTCGVLITDEESASESDALNTVREKSGSPSHLKHDRIALQRVVYIDSENE